MIEIILATYNGEEFLSEQLDSILNQTVTDWHLTVQDDCSSDSTGELLQQYAARYPEKITFLQRPTSSGSAQCNFLDLLHTVTPKLSERDYVMFCDQDDIWFPNKIERTLCQMKAVEASYADPLPVLIHTDLQIIDQNGKLLAPSMAKYQKLNFKKNSFSHLIVQNHVTGNTMMCNLPLCRLAVLGKGAYMIVHDWWIAMVASAFGVIGYLTEPTVSYRQHSHNQLGAKPGESFLHAGEYISERQKKGKKVPLNYVQAEFFQRIYDEILPDQSQDCLERYLSIPEKNKIVRIFTLLRYGYLKQSFASVVGQLIFC